MAWPLVVEREAAAVVADVRDPTGHVRPALREGVGRGVGVGRPLDVDRLEDIAREEVLDVHEEQLLVLLLVVAAELDEVEQRLVEGPVLEPGDELLLDVLAVGRDLGDARAGHVSARGAGVTLAHGLVVAVEEIAEGGVARSVGRVGTEDELLEEPRGVGSVPLRRAGLGH